LLFCLPLGYQPSFSLSSLSTPVRNNSLSDCRVLPLAYIGSFPILPGMCGLFTLCRYFLSLSNHNSSPLGVLGVWSPATSDPFPPHSGPRSSFPTTTSHPTNFSSGRRPSQTLAVMYVQSASPRDVLFSGHFGTFTQKPVRCQFCFFPPPSSFCVVPHTWRQAVQVLDSPIAKPFWFPLDPFF